MNRSNHALRRARERYGIKISAKNLDEITALISKGKAHHLEKRGRLDVYAVSYNGDVFIAAYGRKEKRVLTFMPYVKYIKDIERLGLIAKVNVYSICNKCGADVRYSINGTLTSVARNGKTTELKKGIKWGECHLCLGMLIVHGVKKSIASN